MADETAVTQRAMMQKQRWWVGLMCLLVSLVSAADGVGILRFKLAEGVQQEDVRAQIEAFVYEAFVKERRFTVLERAQLEALEVERFLQEAMSSAEQVKLKDLGARWLVIGEVNQATSEGMALESGGEAYTAVVSFGLRILDVETGRVAYSEQFSSSSGSMTDVFKNLFDDKSSRGGALRAALKDLEKPLARFIDLAFPIYAQIVSIERTGRGGAAKEVLIAKGPADGITPKTRLIAFERSTMTVDGKELVRERELANLEVVRSEGEHLSVCKVGKGGELISARLNAGQVLHAKVK